MRVSGGGCRPDLGRGVQFYTYYGSRYVFCGHNAASLSNP